MKLEAAELCRMYSDDDDDYVTEDYSGRNMYGSTTAGFVTNDIMRVIAAMLCGLGECERYTMADAIRNMKTDSMGMKTIYY